MFRPMDQAIAWQLNGSPSQNFTSFRRLKVQVVPSAETVQLSASDGVISVEPGGKVTSVWVTCWKVCQVQ